MHAMNDDRHAFRRNVAADRASKHCWQRSTPHSAKANNLMTICSLAKRDPNSQPSLVVLQVMP
eukprot:440175-Amphidinium_carterae.1